MQRIERIIGCRVIYKTSDPVSYEVGNLVRVQKVKNTPFPVVIKKSDDEELVVFGIVVPYSRDLARILDEMNFAEQYDYLLPFNMNR
jgi:hypothetical protein